MEKQDRRKFMDDHCKQWLTSGMSKQCYCKAHNLVYHQFIYFVGRFEREQSLPGFIKIEAMPIPNLKGGVVLHLSNGNFFTFADGTPIQLMQQLARQC